MMIWASTAKQHNINANRVHKKQL